MSDARLDSIEQHLLTLSTTIEQLVKHPNLQPQAPLPQAPPVQAVPAGSPQNPVELYEKITMVVGEALVRQKMELDKQMASVEIPCEQLLQPDLWNFAQLSRVDLTCVSLNFSQKVIQPRKDKTTTKSIIRDLDQIQMHFDHMVREAREWLIEQPRDEKADKKFWKSHTSLFKALAVEKLAILDVLVQRGPEAAEYYASQLTKPPLPADVYKKVQTAVSKGDLARALGVLHPSLQNGGS
eukprot:PhF_6_TR8799/c0_g1_i1/m.13972